MRSKRKTTLLVDADKDVDTNDTENNVNINHTEYRGSPPPLPELIFGVPHHKPNPTLVGSITSLDDVVSPLNGNGSYDDHETDATLSKTDNRNIDINSNTEGTSLRHSIDVSRLSTSDLQVRKDTTDFNQRTNHPSNTLGSFKYSRQRLQRGQTRNFSTSCGRATSYDGKLDTPLDVAAFIVSLRKERSKLLQEIELEDKERSVFYEKLETLNQRLRSLPFDYNVGCERWRTEGEMYRIQETMAKRLGSPSVMLRRRDHRLHTINAIEKTIQRLRQDNTSTSTMSVPHNTSDDSNTSQVTMDYLNANQVKLEDGQTLNDPSDLQPINSTNPTTEAKSGLTETEPFIHPTIEAVLKGTWPFEKALWHSSPASMGLSYQSGPETNPSIMSSSSVTNRRAQSQQHLLSNKVEMVYGLLSMFSSGDKDTMSRTLLAMSSSPDSCLAMRQSGCLPLLIQLVHGGDDSPPTREARLRAGQTLHNIVHSHPDDKRGRREARVLRLLEQIRDYSDYLYEKLERTCAGRGPLLEDDMDRHPCPAMAALMKLSFDEDHRHAMCTLGGLHAIAELIRRDHEAHGSTTADQYCITLRRYAGMALTNLTFGDGTNKALLCSFRSFMKALVLQLHSPSEDLRQVTASVLRNLSWRADSGSKVSLREVGSVKALMQAALTAKKESTLKVILSAIWNLSAHCSMNKADICTVEGALSFLCSTLTYKSQSKTLSIVENGGGILRNISSHIAIREELRQILRDNNALGILLTQLRSPSLTVVSNACGTLWNLSARCQSDQKTLWELGAVPMLKSLMNSKHKMISMGSSAALKNLLQAKPDGISLLDHRNGGLPTLQARKQRALVQELDLTLSETCDNIESSPRASPTSQLDCAPMPNVPLYHSLGPPNDFMSESRETIASTHSDKSHDRRRLKLNSVVIDDIETRECDANGSYGSRSGSDDGSQRKLHSKVSMLGDKYCNGSKKRDHSISRKSKANHTLDDEDQPTDFAFRYAEERGHDMPNDNEDTIQTFYTEDTPYETPHMGSTAGSLTDLSNGKRTMERRKDKNSKLSLYPKEMDDIEIEDLEDNSTTTKDCKTREDKPVSYCVEDTPLSLSRFSSVSSLSSGEINDHIDNELLDDEDDTEQLEEPDLKDDTVPIAANPSVKRSMGSHTPSDNRGPGCDETPLMFSRTTSLGSLSSCDAHSIHDDRSSVVSRFNSGFISPSDLPDSPSQTMPSSPKVSRPKSTSQAPSRNSLGVFRDAPRTFMLEGSPNLSVGTSLSSLTFENEDFLLTGRSLGDGKDSSNATTVSGNSQALCQPSFSRPESRSSQKEHQSRNNAERPTNLPRNSRSVSLGRDQNDEKKLAALIQSGTPSRKTPTGARAMLSPSMQPMPLPPPPKILDLVDNRPSAIPIKTANLTVTVESINLGPPPQQKATTGGDVLMSFCTEGTPANISNAGSISDLSQLSFQTDSTTKSGLKSPKPLPHSETDDDIDKKRLLEKCIQSGMPKPRGVVRPKAKAPLPRPPTQKTPSFGVNRPPTRTVPVARIKPAIKNELTSPMSSKQPPTLKSPVEASSKKIAGLKNIPPRSTSASRLPQKLLYKDEQAEVPVKFNVENTPATLSRHSSLSSIGIEEDRMSVPSTKADSVKKFAMENTPVCFSRNSSLSSLSVASYEDETSPREQALLQKCITQGMPKTKSDLGESSRKPVSRIPSLRSPAKSAVPALRQVRPVVSSDSESESRKLRTDVSENEKIVNSGNSRTETREKLMQTSSSSDEAKNSSKDSAVKSESSISESAICAEALQLAMSDKLTASDEVYDSLNSEILENIMPPSGMSSLLSLSGSTVGVEEKRKIECRHTKVPQMVRRALGEHDGCGSMASSCHSNIDNIQPPSLMMDEDMESSMISVASITSEVMDPKESPPSIPISQIHGPANEIAEMLLNETTSSKTLVGDEASTYQEVTEIPDETLAVGGASDTEPAELDVPDLPLDSPARYASPKLTPKNKRSLLRERMLVGASESSSVDSSRSNSPKSRSPKNCRRLLEPDRFKTRTIASGIVAKPSVVTFELNGNGSDIRRPDPARRSFKQRRQDDPSRYLTRTIESPVTALKDQHEVEDSGMVDFQDTDMELTPQQLEVLSQEANMVICSLNEAREASNDAAELFQEENIMDIETLSLISNEDEEELMQQIEDDVSRRGPRIVKPGEETVVEKEIAPPPSKVIRPGKRKPIQSSGRHQGHPCPTKGNPPTAKVVPVAAKPLPSNVKIPRPTRASTLRQNSNKSNEDITGRASDSTPGSSAGSSPKVSTVSRTAQNSTRHSAPPESGLPQLQRQNTFTKEDKKVAISKAQARRPTSGPARSIVRPKVRKEDMRANERTY